jgi:hypothetical protein
MGNRWAGGGTGGRRWRSGTRGHMGCTRTRTSTSRSCAASSSRPSSWRATHAPTSASAPSASWSVARPLPKPYPLLPSFHSAPTHDSRFGFDLVVAPCSSTRVWTGQSVAPRGFARVSAPFLPPSCVSSMTLIPVLMGELLCKDLWEGRRRLCAGAKKGMGELLCAPHIWSARCRDREWVRCMGDRLEGYRAVTVFIWDPFW